jgi:methionine biosynthesis protein MetW
MNGSNKVNGRAPASAFIARPDFEAIAAWIKPRSRVLDLGCGDGALLAYLKKTRDISGYGVEIDADNIVACVGNGVNVIQSDLEADLSAFADASFDHVVLSQTLQAMKHTELIIGEMLRVGREGIVTFPNFGYWRYRLQVLRGGMPVTEGLPYQWYETPNIHLCTIEDFETFCRQHGVRILERLVLSSGRRVEALPNLLGMLAVYRFEKER